MMRLLAALGGREIEVDRLRVWDFYLLFPQALDHASLPKAHASKLRKLLRQRYSNQYEILPDLRTMFMRLEPIQNSALAHLAARNLLDTIMMKSHQVRLVKNDFSKEFLVQLSRRNSEDHELIDFLINAFLDVPLFGKDGIRQRSDLFDCRYDTI